jgi:hypothetical protein
MQTKIQYTDPEIILESFTDIVKMLAPKSTKYQIRLRHYAPDNFVDYKDKSKSRTRKDMVNYIKQLHFPVYQQSYGADQAVVVGVNDMNDVNNIINNLVNRDFTFAIQKVDPRSKGNVLVLDEKWYGPHATK